MAKTGKETATILDRIHAAELDENSIESNPIKQFGIWLKDAKESGLFNYSEAMTLCTASKKGVPTSRVVLLKEFSDNGFVFYTNYKSRKGMDLQENPVAVLNFYWPVIERQVNISGKIEKVSTEESQEYFESRPRGSQIGAWASPQSELVDSRQQLDDYYDKYENLFQGKDVTRPDHWGGYRLIPDKIEFWKARADRFHDRIQYLLITGHSWEKKRIAP